MGPWVYFVTSVAVLHETASAAHLARGLRAAAASVWCCYRDDSESEGGRCHGCRSASNSTSERTGLQSQVDALLKANMRGAASRKYSRVALVWNSAQSILRESVRIGRQVLNTEKDKVRVDIHHSVICSHGQTTATRARLDSRVALPSTWAWPVSIGVRCGCERASSCVSCVWARLASACALRVPHWGVRDNQKRTSQKQCMRLTGKQ